MSESQRAVPSEVLYRSEHPIEISVLKGGFGGIGIHQSTKRKQINRLMTISSPSGFELIVKNRKEWLKTVGT